MKCSYFMKQCNSIAYPYDWTCKNCNAWYYISYKELAETMLKCPEYRVHLLHLSNRTLIYNGYILIADMNFMLGYNSSYDTISLMISHESSVLQSSIIVIISGFFV